MKKNLFLLVLAGALMLSACGASGETEPAARQETVASSETVAASEPVTLRELEPHLELVASAVADFYGLDPDPDEICYPIYESKEAWENREAPTGLTLLPNYDDYSDCFYRPIRQFSGKADWLDTVRPLLTEDLLSKWEEARIWENNTLEFAGHPYFVFGPMGYGAYEVQLDTAVLTPEGEGRCTVTADTLYFGEPDMPVRIQFIRQEDGWRVSEYELIYP